VQLQKPQSNVKDKSEAPLPEVPPVEHLAPRPKQDLVTKLFGYMNSAGGWVIEPSFESADLFDNDLAFVEYKNGSGGLIDLSGTIVTPNVQSAIWLSETTMTESKFSEGLLAVRDFSSNKVGFVNSKGHWVIKPAYADASEFHEKMASFRVTAKGKVGFIDPSGRVVISPKFGTNFRVPPFFSEGLAAIGLNDDWPRTNLDPPSKIGYINRYGKWIIKPIYSSASSFHNGRAKATLKEKEVELRK